MRLAVTCFILSSLISLPVFADALRLSEPVQTDEHSETFGTPIEDLPELVQISELVSSPDKFMQTPIAMTARVAKVCQKKGCFFVAQQGDDNIRVSFVDYSFFVPTDIGGRDVTLVGELVAHEISPEMAKHFSKDLGEENAIQSGRIYEVVARSVRVLRPES
ncbi:MAG: DUF4920 domain-containing protein [Pseudomonadota bacterium]